MRQKIAVGSENFIELRQSDSYYVDKTELLYDLFHETNNKVTLFTRMQFRTDIIEKNGYARGFDGYRQILKYGISFYKKSALVKKAVM